MKWSYSTVYNYSFLGCLVLFGVSMGIWNEIISPTLPNLRQKLDISYQQLGNIQSIKIFSNIAALILIGVINDSFPHLVNVFMIIECLLCGICTFIMPWTKQIWIFAAVTYIQAAGTVTLTNGCQLNILRIFGKQAVGIMQISHLGYGIGKILSGLIAKPFLSNDKTKSSNFILTKYCQNKLNYSKLNSTQFANNNLSVINSSIKYNASTDNIVKYSFEYIYVISGCISLISVLIFILHLLFMKKPKSMEFHITKKQSLKQTLSKDFLIPHLPNVSILYPLTMIILLFIWYISYLTGVLVFSHYLIVYATDPCKSYYLTQSQAALLFTSVNASFLIGRFCFSFLMLFRPGFILIIANLCNILFNLLLALYANDIELVLWICTCGMRFMNGPIYPAGTSFINRYIQISSTIISIAFIGSSLGISAGTALGGYLLDNYPSTSTIFACLTAMIILFLVTMCIFILGSIYGERPFVFKAKTSSETTEIKNTDKL